MKYPTKDGKPFRLMFTPYIEIGPDRPQSGSTPPRVTDIAHGEMRLDHIDNVPSPALVIINRAKKTVHTVKYFVGVWNVDLPGRIDPLPIPVDTVDFIRSGDNTGPLYIFSSPTVAALIKPNDHLVGSLSIDSPDWDSGVTYIVSVIGSVAAGRKIPIAPD